MANTTKSAHALAVALLALAPGSAGAQAQEPPAAPAKPCAAPEIQQFAFWIGEWDLTWDRGKGRGTNSIRWILDGCVVHEHFQEKEGEGPPLEGWSVSSWSPLLRKWQQTWVDNQAGYLDFQGGLEDGRMVLSRRARGADGKEFLQRMVWQDIRKDTLTWNWERSDDEGKSWRTLWKIDYGRRK
jgi:hypothetical protein